MTENITVKVIEQPGGVGAKKAAELFRTMMHMLSDPAVYAQAEQWIAENQKEVTNEN